VGLNHLIRQAVYGQLLGGDGRTTNASIDITYQIDSKVIQSLSRDNVFTSDFNAEYIQLRTINQERSISLTQSEPQTLNGFELQQTFIAPCQILNSQVSDPNQLCTLLPPLVTDRNSLDPRFFIPTRIEQKGKIGDVISPESLNIIKQPGFQNVGANGEFTGIDLYFPNVGGILGNSQSNQTSISRQESVKNNYSLGYYRFRQIIKTNSQRAVLGQTLRGVGIIVDDKNLVLNTVLGVAGQFLPDVEPSLEGTTEDTNTNINKNLFSAANNIRLPVNSFVIYQAGVGEADHIRTTTDKITNTSGSSTPVIEPVAEMPSGIFNGVWVGMSPVIKRSSSQDLRYIATGPERTIVSAGGEGGTGSNASFVTASNQNGISNVIGSANLSNFYVQAYLSFLQRDVNLVSTDTLTEKTSYYPHISFTGNITNENSVFRYYTGAIISDNLKPYVGADYNLNLDDWLLTIGAIAYINGDRDYFSNTQGSLSRKIQLSPDLNLGLFTAFSYAWNRVKGNFLDNPSDNFVSVGSNLNFNNFSFQVSQLLDLLPDSTGNRLQASATARLDGFSLTAYFSPQRTLDDYGMSLQYALRDPAVVSSIILAWNRTIYRFGDDNFGKNLETANNVFSLTFKTFFR
jgi:hypothetical protein